MNQFEYRFIMGSILIIYYPGIAACGKAVGDNGPGRTAACNVYMGIRGVNDSVDCCGSRIPLPYPHL